jgi:NADH-quinone oxidoreductase subunit F
MNNAERRIIICAGTGCVANGSLKVYEEFKRILGEKNIPVTLEFKKEEHNHDGIRISKSGCQGFCQMGPLVTIMPQEILYTKVKAQDVNEIVETTLSVWAL